MTAASHNKPDGSVRSCERLVQLAVALSDNETDRAALVELAAGTPEISALADCPQDPVYHAEGDVLVHTSMVLARLRELLADTDFDAVSEAELLLAALFHDAGKAPTTRFEDGRLRAPHHAAVGERIARRLLWEAGSDPRSRERICELARAHMTPYHMLDRPEAPHRTLIGSCLLQGARRLITLSRADAAGRTSLAGDDKQDEVTLFAELASELGCLETPYRFASDHARVEFFSHPGRELAYVPYDDTRCRMTIMSGLPGAGKDHWIEHHGEHEPVVSLDRLRGGRRLGQREQGRVIQESRELLRQRLRASENVIFNATCLSKQARRGLLRLAADYRARVRIVCVEADARTIFERAQRRPSSAQVPEKEIIRLASEVWEPPRPDECHELIVSDGSEATA